MPPPCSRSSGASARGSRERRSRLRPDGSRGRPRTLLRDPARRRRSVAGTSATTTCCAGGPQVPARPPPVPPRPSSRATAQRASARGSASASMAPCWRLTSASARCPAPQSAAGSGALGSSTARSRRSPIRRVKARGAPRAPAPGSSIARTPGAGAPGRSPDLGPVGDLARFRSHQGTGAPRATPAQASRWRRDWREGSAGRSPGGRPICPRQSPRGARGAKLVLAGSGPPVRRGASASQPARSVVQA
jgi:hypothetical protein